MNNSVDNFTMHESSNSSLVSNFMEIGMLEIVVFGFSFLFGFPMNIYVIWLIVTRAVNELTSDAFILNLSVCGLLFSLNSLLLLLTHWFELPSLMGLSQFFLGLIMTGSPLFQCLMCVERYLAVVHPVTFLKYKPLRYRVICCSVAWIITLGSCVLTLLSFLGVSVFIFIRFFSLQFLLFFSIQLFCCVAVLRALKQSGPGERKREREENQIRSRAIIIIVITTVSTVTTYVPFTVTSLLSVVTQQLFHTHWAVSYVFFMLSAFVPPFLYLHRTVKLSSLSICSMLRSC